MTTVHGEVELERKEDDQQVLIGDGKTLKRAGFFAQFKLLVWKNWLIKKTQKCESIMELLLPVIIGLLMTALRSLSSLSPQQIPAFSNADSLAVSQLFDAGLNLNNLTALKFSSSALDQIALSTLRSPLGKAFPLDCTLLGTNVPNYANNLFQYFDSAYGLTANYGLTLQQLIKISEQGAGSAIPALQSATNSSTLSSLLFLAGSLLQNYVNHNLTYGMTGQLVIIPDDSVTRAFGAFLNQSSFNANGFGPCFPSVNITFLGNEDQLNSIVSANDYVFGTVSAAVVFQSKSPNWNYKIRMATSVLPATNKYTTQFASGFATLTYFSQYVQTSGFGALQNLVDEFIMLYDTGRNGTSAPFHFYQVWANQFPTPAYTQDTFWSLMENIAVLFFLLVYLWPFTRMVKLILEERTYKIKEGMKMMGVGDSAIWISWFISYALVYLVGSLILAAILKINVYRYTSFGYVFLLFFSFALSIVTLGFLFTVLFKDVRTAIQFAILFFIAGYIIFTVVNSSSSTTPSGMSAMCLFAPACFGATILASSSLEAAQLGVTADTFSTVINNASFGTTIGFFYLDCVIYLLLTWYLGNVIPSEYGTTRPWWFIFDYNYWCPRKDIPRSPDYKAVQDDYAVLQGGDLYEEIGAEVAKLEGIRIRKLRKEFAGAADGQPLVAVDSVDVDMFENEVFALLGHNGAGKTTTISMLTGLIEISSGDAMLFGRSIRHDIDQVHNMIGVCPQQNVLFDNLTVKEHLQFFAGLKGVPSSAMDALIKSVIADVGLTEKVNSKSSTLSGGQKRKLCVAMAFIGDPRVVFLDEPTSGMDVNSRRSTWDLIKKYKKNRVIILTTHFMDEADLLADRIGIMAKGNVVCCGSSLFLKSKYGVGYTFVINKKEGEETSSKLREFLSQNLSSFEVVHDIGGEMFARIPLSASPEFPALFRRIERQKHEIGIINYGISVTTLEEVFIKVGHNPSGKVEDLKQDDELKRRLSFSRIKSAEQKNDHDILEIMKMSSVNPNQNPVEVFVRHFFALLTKRWQYLKRDRSAIGCLTLLPCILLIVSVIALQAIAVVSTSTLAMNMSHYSTPVPVPAFMPNNTGPLASGYIPSNAYIVPITFDYFASSSAMNTTADVLNTIDPTLNKTIWGAVGDVSNLTGTSPLYRFFLYANETALHAIPVYLNLISSATLRYLTNGTSTVSVSSQPLPQSPLEQQNLQRTSAILVSYFFNQALIFVPSTIVVFIVMEKQSKAKHQQLISGVSIPAYWLSNYVFDLLCYVPLFILEIIITRALRSGLFSGIFFGPTVVLFFLFGLTYIPFTYFTAFFFSNPLTARIVTLVLAYVTGPILTLVSFALNISSTTKTINNGLIYIWRIFPAFNFGNGLMNIATDSSNENPFDWGVAGEDIIYLVWEAVVYTLLVIISEYMLSVPNISKALRTFFGFETDLPKANEEEDSDVLAEKQRVQSGQADQEMVQVRGLRKVYGGRRLNFGGCVPSFETYGKVAVKDMWYSIPKGECFGFLGINGAGKTTTLEILSGDIFPTQGSGTLGGFDILKNQLAVRRLIGYCPQFDALFPKLTAREHLEFYAKLKGVDRSKMKVIVDGMIHYLSLGEYANRPAGTYSGGNKRKLSVAMSLIGDPPIVFLDEPSSGMDPVARRFMWRFISETMPGRSVILTTHSMDECEALCNRIGIMVGGRLRCLGNAQHLKDKYGAGYQLDINGQTHHGEDVFNGVMKLFPTARLLERHDSVMKFQLPTSAAGVSDLASVFELLEMKKQEIYIREYSVSQTSLEQIFIRFAREQDEEKGVAEGYKGTQGLTSGPVS